MKRKFRTFVEIYKRVALNKLYIFIIGLLIGGILVYFVGGFVPRLIIQNTRIVKENEQNSSKKSPTPHRSNKQKITPRNNNPAITSDSLAIDSLTSSSDIENQDSITMESEDIIDHDRLIKVSTLPISKFMPRKDTSYAEKLATKIGKDESFLDDIVVEFWESPLEYTGYKLNKSKLILYGISTDNDLELSYDSKADALKLLINGNPTYLRKTEQFKSISFQ